MYCEVAGDGTYELMPNYSCQTCTVLLVALNAATSSDSVRFMTPID
jgi:hypothetical protein